MPSPGTTLWKAGRTARGRTARGRAEAEVAQVQTRSQLRGKGLSPVRHRLGLGESHELPKCPVAVGLGRGENDQVPLHSIRGTDCLGCRGKGASPASCGDSSTLRRRRLSRGENGQVLLVAEAPARSQLGLGSRKN